MKSNENQPAALDKQNPVGSGSQKLSQLIDFIEERANKATPGPWIQEKDRNEQICLYSDDGNAWVALLPHQCVKSIEEQCQRNADFIASSRTDVPKLVKALRRAIDRFTFIQEQEIVGASNVAQWAKDDILFILGDRADVGEEKPDLGERGAV